VNLHSVFPSWSKRSFNGTVYSSYVSYDMLSFIGEDEVGINSKSKITTYFSFVFPKTKTRSILKTLPGKVTYLSL
jgi:hypothetical protein